MKRPLTLEEHRAFGDAIKQLTEAIQKMRCRNAYTKTSRQMTALRKVERELLTLQGVLDNEVCTRFRGEDPAWIYFGPREGT